MKLRYIGTGKKYKIYKIRSNRTNTLEQPSFLVYFQERWQWIEASCFKPTGGFDWIKRLFKR
jgi:hypothetical protein